MGQKVNPISFRNGPNGPNWSSLWYAPPKAVNPSGCYRYVLDEDIDLRDFIIKFFPKISRVNISRYDPSGIKIVITIYAARSSDVLGKGGAKIVQFQQAAKKKFAKDLSVNVVEIKRPELDAKTIADSIASQLENRSTPRRAVKRHIASFSSGRYDGNTGIKIICSGRLNGVEIARSEEYRYGKVPLHTLRADIDYAVATAHTPMGTCGVKVWVYKGEVGADLIGQDNVKNVRSRLDRPSKRSGRDNADMG